MKILFFHHINSHTANYNVLIMQTFEWFCCFSHNKMMIQLNRHFISYMHTCRSYIGKGISEERIRRVVILLETGWIAVVSCELKSRSVYTLVGIIHNIKLILLIDRRRLWYNDDIKVVPADFFIIFYVVITLSAGSISHIVVL